MTDETLNLIAAPRFRGWIPPGVYRPDTDTALLGRALLQERITGRTEVLDLGTGSGALAVAAARRGARVTAVDISWTALATAWCNALRNGRLVRVRHGDLVSAVPGRHFDLVITNPPYVPAPPGDGPPRGRARSWDAGPDGRLLIDRICTTTPAVLRPAGRLLMVHSRLSGVEETLARLGAAGMNAEIVDRALLPLGPVLRSRLDWLRERGLVADRTTEELVVIRAEHA
ncbi:HemK2/MTQ2 family protein methyltransferase [Streptomyces sp. NPDC001443]